MKIKRRFPNYFTGFEETEHEVNSKEDLLKLDWIEDLKNMKGWLGLFYSPKKYDDTPDYLMSLSKNDEGKIIYFVIGYIYGDGKELGLTDYVHELKKDIRYEQ